ncbi:MAG: transporter substrate-binding domain-containing protein [Hyphomicrobiales bacterium]|nr:transporter substrate-binding domain-containing protein [Hyphomicrobiales bacterium]
MTTNVKSLLKTGILRAGLFLPQYRLDDDGKVVGVSMGIVGSALTQAMAEHFGVEARIQTYPTPPAALNAIKAGDCDIAFMGIEPSREAQLDFTPPAVQFDYTYMVPPGSAIRTAADADKPGARISAVAGHASTMALLPQIRHAQVILNDIPDDTFALVRDGKAEAIAMPREILDAYLPQWPEAKILDDRFGVNNVGVGMAKGQPELLAQISAFIEEAKASGMIATVIAGADMPFFKVAPPAAQ